MSDAAEFDIIRKYFTTTSFRDDVILGVGDDAAILQPPEAQQLVVTLDTLVAGVHFPLSTSPADIAYKTVAVNLSDLAAMGAQPAWAVLALTLPDVNESWLKAFSTSLQQTLTAFGVQLVGGDTTQGPLSVSLQLTGFVNANRILRRDGAEVGDRIYVSGTLGDAALGLELLQTELAPKSEFFLQRLHRPTPRIELGRLATQHCSCAIDISDGLLADLGHILTSSRCGAIIHKDRIPLSESFKQYYAEREQPPNWQQVLQGGDDYELCLTVKSTEEDSFVQLIETLDSSVTCIGHTVQTEGLQIVDVNGHTDTAAMTGFEHFKG